jgi:zinc/manganese transport system substrate-binding protein
MRLTATVVLATALTLTSVGCGASPSTGGPGSGPDGTTSNAPEARPVILASTSIWADIVSHVACDGLATVDTLIPVGGDPHSAELSLADRGHMEAAAAIVVNGLFLEDVLADTIDAVEATGVPVFRIGDHIETIETIGSDDDHGHGNEGADPHVWFDPVRLSAVLPALADHLLAAANLDAEVLAACVRSYQSELAAVDSEVERILAPLAPPRRKLVTTHDALGYFAHRYHLEVVGVVVPSSSTLAATNPAQLEALAAVVADAGVPAVFADSQHSQAESEALAQRVGNVEVVTLFTDSLGEAGSGAETYLGLLRTNAQLIAAALA